MVDKKAGWWDNTKNFTKAMLTGDTWSHIPDVGKGIAKGLVSRANTLAQTGSEHCEMSWITVTGPIRKRS